jgi:hypothetical protein
MQLRLAAQKLADQLSQVEELEAKLEKILRPQEETTANTIIDLHPLD